MQIETISNEIIRVATHFINLYEVKANAEWRLITDPSKGKEESYQIHEAMKASGWQDGWPYCAAFCESVWRLAYTNLQAPQSVLDDFGKKLCPSVMTSFNAFKGRITHNPLPGSIFFMQKGKSANGHAGLVVGCDGKNIATIEGNTSAGKAVSAEADRNGDGIFKKVRTLDFTETSGLYLKGFLNPIVW